MGLFTGHKSNEERIFSTHSIFKDKEKNDQFFKDGYFIFDLISKEQAEEIYTKLKVIDSNYKEGFNISFSSKNVTVKKKIDLIIKESLSNKINLLADHYKLFCAGYALKKNGKGSYFFLHTDDSISDEKNNVPFTIWIPLIDVNKNNGCLAIIPGSHLYTDYYRNTPMSDPILKIKATELNKLLVNIELKAGQSIVFHPAVLHYSHDNLSTQERPALILACLPEAAQAQVIYNKKKIILDDYYAYELTEDLLYNWDWRNEPNTKKITKVFPIKKINKSKILKKLQSHGINKIGNQSISLSKK